MTAAEEAAVTREEIWSAVAAGTRSTLVDSPPGAGKSTLVREVGRRARQRSQVPIVVQTNDQADDMIRGFGADAKNGASPMLVGRLHASTNYSRPADLIGRRDVVFGNRIGDLSEADIIIAPAAKWATVGFDQTWPFAIVDEAYQMRSDMLLPIGEMMESLLLVGDPGQLAPFTIADETGFRGRPLSPLETAAATVLTTQPNTVRLALPVSWRLPPSAAETISDAFYQIPFTAGTEHGQRRLQRGVTALHRGRAGDALSEAIRSGWAYVELDDHVMPQADPDLVDTLVDLVAELVGADITVEDERGHRALRPADIAVGVVHTDQRDYVRTALQEARSRTGVPVDEVIVNTANVLQGREFEIVLVWHPLSGRRDASQFHLDAGRLCVLLSRHRQACIVVSRGGVREQLAGHAPTEPVWLGEAAPVLDGWHAHLTILDHLATCAV